MEKNKPSAVKRCASGGASLRWFNLTAGINGILPASGGAPAIYSVVRLEPTTLRAQKKYLTLAFEHCGVNADCDGFRTKAREVSYCQTAAKMDQKKIKRKVIFQRVLTKSAAS